MKIDGYVSIQCTAQNGEKGSFYRDDKGNLISPVFSDSYLLSRWRIDNNIPINDKGLKLYPGK